MLALSEDREHRAQWQRAAESSEFRFLPMQTTKAV
jgi:hypothetical protein